MANRLAWAEVCLRFYALPINGNARDGQPTTDDIPAPDMRMTKAVSGRQNIIDDIGWFAESRL